LDTLLTGGWKRVAKDRIDPVAWSYRYGLQRKTERQSWRYHFIITERNGKQSSFELPCDRLVPGASAIRFLTKAGCTLSGVMAYKKRSYNFCALSLSGRSSAYRAPAGLKSERTGFLCGRME
jgi:hypothetical protein